MSHSSSDKPLGKAQEEIMEGFRKRELDDFQKKIEGTFPDGKLAEHDEGALAFAVGLVDNKVVIDFAKPVKSFGMTPDQAIQLASLLLRRAGYSKGIKFEIKLSQ